MGALIVFLLFVAVLLICTPRAERGLALGAMALVGAVIWLAVRIHLHSIVGSMVGTVLALGWEYRNDLLLFFAAAIVLIVPILMIYMTACDRARQARGCEKNQSATFIERAWTHAAIRTSMAVADGRGNIQPHASHFGKKTQAGVRGLRATESTAARSVFLSNLTGIFPTRPSLSRIFHAHGLTGTLFCRISPALFCFDLRAHLISCGTLQDFTPDRRRIGHNSESVGSFLRQACSLG